MRVVLYILRGVVVPALIAGLAAIPVILTIGEGPQPDSAKTRADGEVDGWNPRLIYTHELGILSDECHAAHRSEVKAPVAEILRSPMAFVGVHLLKENPELAQVAYYYCKPLNDQVSQCLLYDSTGPEARLIGVEYLVSEEAYEKMPAEEKVYWHDHKHEVDAGLLRSLTQSDIEEEATLAKVRTLRGKIYHTWASGRDIPLGPARLFWSVTGQSPFLLPEGIKLPPALESARH